MGREALCQCTFEGTTGKVKALLESHEIILRGDIRMSAPLDALKNVRVEAESLCFNIDKRPMQLRLGTKAAESWARKIKTPPPTLADKLGITGKVVRTIGPVADQTLYTALCSTALVRAEKPDLILACVDTPESLMSALREAKTQLDKSPSGSSIAKAPGTLSMS